MADWLAVKLHEKGIPGHKLADRMGIASGLVHAWKDGTAKPKACHVRDMVRVLGKYCPSATAR
jgi:predicted transcriptional regulator